MQIKVRFMKKGKTLISKIKAFISNQFCLLSSTRNLPRINSTFQKTEIILNEPKWQNGIMVGSDRLAFTNHAVIKALSFENTTGQQDPVLPAFYLYRVFVIVNQLFQPMEFINIPYFLTIFPDDDTIFYVVDHTDKIIYQGSELTRCLDTFY